MQYIVIIGSLAQIIGITFYIKDIIKSKIQPNRVSWLLWSAAPIIGSIAAFVAGAGWAALPIFAAGFGPLLVFLITFFNKKSYWKLGKFDYVCGALSILALILWAITKNPAVAIFFSILSDLFAAIPTLTKGWYMPETESAGPYLTGAFNAATSFFAIKIWNFSSFGYPLYLLIINGLLYLSIQNFSIKRKHK